MKTLILMCCLILNSPAFAATAKESCADRAGVELQATLLASSEVRYVEAIPKMDAISVAHDAFKDNPEELQSTLGKILESRSYFYAGVPTRQKNERGFAYYLILRGKHCEPVYMVKLNENRASLRF